MATSYESTWVRRRVRYVLMTDRKAAGSGKGLSSVVLQPIKRQWKTLYDEAAENEPPPWAQQDCQLPGYTTAYH